MSGEVPSATTPLKLYELECTGGVWATYKRRDVHAPQAGGAVDYVKLCEIIAASKHCDPNILMLFDGSITCDPNLPEAVHACLKDDFVPVRNAVTFYVKPPAPTAGAPVTTGAGPLAELGLTDEHLRQLHKKLVYIAEENRTALAKVLFGVQTAWADKLNSFLDLNRQNVGTLATQDRVALGFVLGASGQGKTHICRESMANSTASSLRLHVTLNQDTSFPGLAEDTNAEVMNPIYWSYA